jgi:hypothetical protein
MEKPGAEGTATGPRVNSMEIVHSLLLPFQAAMPPTFDEAFGAVPSAAFALVVVWAVYRRHRREWRGDRP